MRKFAYLFILLLFAGCIQDMATYTKLSSARCGEKKFAVITPNVNGVDEDIYRETALWLEKHFAKRGYVFGKEEKTNVFITINHEASTPKEDGTDVEKVREVYEGEGRPKLGPLYRHKVTVTVEDKSCQKGTMTLKVDLDSYSESFSDVIPELLDALKESVANTKGPRSKTTKRVSRRF